MQVVLSVLQDDGYTSVDSPEEADVILVNTCAIREHAESRVFSRLGIFKQLKARRQADDRFASSHSLTCLQCCILSLGTMALDPECPFMHLQQSPVRTEPVPWRCVTQG